jgi:hypothetical protein
MTGKSKDFVFLLGAGASVESGIPASGMMIDEIESLLKTDTSWKEFLDLYHHIKSAIYYSAGLKGRFERDVPYNIETLVNTIYELERNEDHPLYPFIAAWNSRLVSLAGDGFARAKQFRRLILERLKNWVLPWNTSLSEYYRGLIQLQRDLNFPVRIFSLNYDMCVERLSSLDFRVETGFEGVGSQYKWDWERFEESDTGPPLPEIYLYKLHGSINWTRDADRNLICLEHPQGINPEDMEIIFGRDFKLEAADPYLFYAYELRKFSLLARMIITIGYGFSDDHINKILAQALSNTDRRLLIISRCNDDAESKTWKDHVRDLLRAKTEQVIVQPGTAKEFLETTELSKQLLDLIPIPADSPF